MHLKTVEDGTMGSVTSLVDWDLCSTPGPAHWVKDPVLLQLGHRSQLWLRSDPCPRNAICCQVVKKEKKKKRWGKEWDGLGVWD